MNQQTNRGFLYGLLGVTAFSLTLPFTKIAVVELHPLFIGFGRAFVAAVPAMFILLLFSKKTEQPLPNKKQFLQLIAISLGIVVGFPIFISLAMRYVPSAYGAVVVGISPLATAVVSMMSHAKKQIFVFGYGVYRELPWCYYIFFCITDYFAPKIFFLKIFYWEICFYF